MKTISLPIQNKINIKEMQKRHSPCYRYCYNRWLDGLNEKEIRELCKDKFKIGSWFVQSIIKDSQSLFKAQNKDFTPKEIIDELIKKKKKKVIFGGKKNLKDYIEGKIDKETFKDNRLIPIISIGEAPQKGNRLFTLDIINNNQIIFKPSRTQHITIQLPKLRNNIKKDLYRLEELANEKRIPFMVKLTEEKIDISFDETIHNLHNLEEYNSSRVLGIDLNPNYCGISILEFKENKEFKVLFKECIDISKLNVKSGESSKHQKSKDIVNKRNFEVFEVVKHIVNQAKYYKCAKVIIEDLNLQPKNNKKGKNFNRLVNNVWNRTRFTSNLKKWCRIYGIELVEVNCAYSSFVGNVQYGNDVDCPDMVASSIEIARRGYRKFNKEWFYPVKKNDDNLMKLWKQELDWSSLSWKELFGKFKESRMKYRFSLKVEDNLSLKLLRLGSYKSNINIYSFI
jgi:IS605 OrfB family transposase